MGAKGSIHLAPGKATARDFALSWCSRVGFPGQGVCMDYDPVLQAVAVGTTEGVIKIYGRPGAEGLLQHVDDDVMIVGVHFLVGQGRLLSLSLSKCKIWDLTSGSITYSFDLSSTVKHTVSHSYLWPCYNHRFLYLGTNSGDVLVLDTLRQQLSSYTIPLSEALPARASSGKGNGVVCMTVNPAEENYLLILYESGDLVLWNLPEKKPHRAYPPVKGGTSLCWSSEGTHFVVGTHGGLLQVWHRKTTSEPVMSFHVARSAADCTPIRQLEWSRPTTQEQARGLKHGRLYVAGGSKAQQGIHMVKGQGTHPLWASKPVFQWLTKHQGSRCLDFLLFPVSEGPFQRLPWSPLSESLIGNKPERVGKPGQSEMLAVLCLSDANRVDCTIEEAGVLSASVSSPVDITCCRYYGIRASVPDDKNIGASEDPVSALAFALLERSEAIASVAQKAAYLTPDAVAGVVNSPVPQVSRISQSSSSSTSVSASAVQVTSPQSVSGQSQPTAASSTSSSAPHSLVSTHRMVQAVLATRRRNLWPLRSGCPGRFLFEHGGPPPPAGSPPPSATKKPSAARKRRGDAAPLGGLLVTGHADGIVRVYWVSHLNELFLLDLLDTRLFLGLDDLLNNEVAVCRVSLDAASRTLVVATVAGNTLVLRLKVPSAPAEESSPAHTPTSQSASPSPAAASAPSPAAASAPGSADDAGDTQTPSVATESPASAATPDTTPEDATAQPDAASPTEPAELPTGDSSAAPKQPVEDAPAKKASAAVPLPGPAAASSVDAAAAQDVHKPNDDKKTEETPAAALPVRTNSSASTDASANSSTSASTSVSNAKSAASITGSARRSSLTSAAYRVCEQLSSEASAASAVSAVSAVQVTPPPGQRPAPPPRKAQVKEQPPQSDEKTAAGNAWLSWEMDAVVAHVNRVQCLVHDTRINRLFVADEGGVISLTNTETGDCLVYGSLADAFGGGGTITATAAHFGSVAVSKDASVPYLYVGLSNGSIAFYNALSGKTVLSQPRPLDDAALHAYLKRFPDRRPPKAKPAVRLIQSMTSQGGLVHSGSKPRYTEQCAPCLLVVAGAQIHVVSPPQPDDKPGARLTSHGFMLHRAAIVDAAIVTTPKGDNVLCTVDVRGDITVFGLMDLHTLHRSSVVHLVAPVAQLSLHSGSTYVEQSGVVVVLRRNFEVHMFTVFAADRGYAQSVVYDPTIAPHRNTLSVIQDHVKPRHKSSLVGSLFRSTVEIADLFNAPHPYHVTQKRRAEEKKARTQKSEQHEEDARKQLLGDRAQTASAAAAPSVAAAGAARSTGHQMSQNLDMMRKNLQKTKEIEEKSEQLANSGADFLALARALKKKQKSSWI